MIEMIIEQRRRNLGGGIEVGRVLPFVQRRMVAPSSSSIIWARSILRRAPIEASTYVRIRISGSRRSPTCSPAR